MFDQGLEYFSESGLDIVERSHGREFGAEDVGATDGAADALLALLVAVVVIAELLAKKSWGTAGMAVGLGEIADATRQGKPPCYRRLGLSASSENRSGRREFGSEMGHACADGRRPTG